MTNERDKKRVMIPIPTGNDGYGRRVLKQGDDVPVDYGDAFASELKRLSEEAELSAGARATPITLESMARYLNALTTDDKGRNAYPVQDGPAVFKLEDRRVSSTSSGLLAGDVFASNDDIRLLEQLGVVGEVFTRDDIERLRDPKVGFNEILSSIVGSGLSSLQKRGGSTVNVSSRRAECDTPPEASPVVKKVSEVLKRNRYSPASNVARPFADGRAASDVDNRTIGRFQSALGGYDSGVGVDNSPADITYEQMKKIGLALMLRATGVPTKDGPPLGDGRTATEAGALVPGTAQLAASRVIEPKSMWAADLAAEQGIPVGASDRSRLPSELTLDNGTASYGNMNSYIAMFDGFAPIATTALGVALVVAIKLLVEGLFLGLSAILKGDASIPVTSHILPLGASRTRTSMAGGLLTLEDLGIHTVRHDYITAVNRGIDVFFELDSFGDYVRVIKSPGYYAVMMRAIIRSGGEVVDAFSNVVNNIQNPVTGIQALAGIIDTIRTSTLIGFINMLAGLGDTVLNLQDSGALGGTLNESTSVKGKISSIDTLNDNALSRQRKSRANTNALALAWRTSATPSLYLLPPSAIKAASVISKDKTNLEMIGGLADARVKTSEGLETDVSVINAPIRLSNDDVKRIEDNLESEYVPFYFHDLRTNEVISFHAFLASCSESFSANYSKDRYYGRVDPVMIYGDTERSISMSFHIVSTNKEDFDVMWWKFNKLITMLYPQWTRGRKLEINQDTFIQPFSQVPGSSPMIRLRLGDVFKSNYSKFALARLFGLGTDDFNLQGSTKPLESTINDTYAKIRARMLTDPLTTAAPSDAGYFATEKAFLSVNEARQAPLQLAGAKSGISEFGARSIQQTSVLLECSIESKIEVPIGPSNSTSYVIKLSEPPAGYSSGPYIVDFNDLEPHDEFVKSLAQKQAGLEPSETPEQQAVESFFSTENNVIVRSFESVRGRGLAGFITSLSVDWKSPTWETELGSRAPQFCTIQLAFSPTHDIAPGLDHDGFNRAPTHNVGRVVQNVGSDPYNDDNAKTVYRKNAAALRKSSTNGEF